MRMILALIILGLIYAFGFPIDGEAKSEGKGEYGPYKAKVVRVIDGDTVELDVFVWPGLKQRIHLRLDGVNTPEKRGKGVTACEKAAAVKASAFTQTFLSGQKSLEVSGIRLGKFAGRVLGHITANGKDLGQALISAGLARPYAGGKRKAWC